MPLDLWAADYADPGQHHRYRELRIEFETGDRRHPTLITGLWLDVSPVQPYPSPAKHVRVGFDEVVRPHGRYYWFLTSDVPHARRIRREIRYPYDDEEAVNG